MGVAGTLPITDVLTNTTGYLLQLPMQLLRPAGTGCVGATVNVVITIDASASDHSGSDETICSGSAVNKEDILNALNLPAGTLFKLPDPDGGAPRQQDQTCNGGGRYPSHQPMY